MAVTDATARTEAVSEKPTNGHAFRSVATRLVEASIIGGIIMYGTVQMMGVRLDSISEQVAELKTDFKKMRDDFYRPQFNR